MEMMNDTQQKAFNIYYDSANMDNSFKPMSFVNVANELKELDLKGSKSAVGRWAVKFKWAEQIEKKVQLSITEDKEVTDLIEKSSINAATKKAIDDFESNERLKGSSYQILEAQMQKYTEKLKKGDYLSHEDEKFILKCLEITATREDKLLDRQAVLQATKLVKSEDTLAALNDATVDVEIEEDE